MKATHPINLTTRSILSGILASCILASFGANIDTYWTGNGGNDDWFDANNWDNGVPQDARPSDIGRTFFTTKYDGDPVDVTIDPGKHAVTNRFYVGNNSAKTVNLTLENGSSFTVDQISQPVVGSPNSGSAHWNVSGPSSGTASMSFNSLTITGTASSSGTTATFSGSGLNILENGTVTTVGRQGNGHTLTINDGATWSGKGLVISGTVNVTSGIGNNHKAVVDGAGTSMTLSGSSGSNATLGIIVGARPVTGLNGSNIQSGNSLTVSNGANVSLIGDNPDATMSMLVGYSHYRVNNEVIVTGNSSRLAISDDAEVKIGYPGSVTYNNRLRVNDDASAKFEAPISVVSMAGAAESRRNYLEVFTGGTLTTNNTITIQNSVLRMDSTSSILAQKIDGTADSATIGLSGNARFEAAGSGLGKDVMVNLSDMATLQIGNGSQTTASYLDLQSLVDFGAGTNLFLGLYDDGTMDTITLLSDAQIDIAAGANLTITGDEITQTGSWQVFFGETDQINGNFDNLILPDVAAELEWDTSGFNEAGAWTLAVIPEPSSSILLAGLFILPILRRQRKHN